jgi:hypothetical protein
MTNFNELLGQTISNLHSFEFVLRNFLFFHNENAQYKSPIASDLYLLKKHDETKLTDFTSYDSLGKLIEKANSILLTKGIPLIDRNVEDIRDCFAHGRVAFFGNDDTKILLKFSKPAKGANIVTLTDRLELTDVWFKDFNSIIISYVKTLTELTIKRTPPSFFR